MPSNYDNLIQDIARVFISATYEFVCDGTRPTRPKQCNITDGKIVTEVTHRLRGLCRGRLVKLLIISPLSHRSCKLESD